MKRTFYSIIADFKKEAAVDFIGFWELVGTVKTYYEDDESENLQMLTLDLMKRMLSQGFKIGYLSGTGNKLAHLMHASALSEGHFSETNSSVLRALSSAD